MLKFYHIGQNQLENYDKVYISEKVVEENNEPREVEFMIIDGVLMWRYRGDTEWKPIMPLDDVGCTLGSSEEQQ